MSVRLGRRMARRVSIGLLGACGAVLAVLFAVPAAREADLSATRASTYRLPKRKLAPFARRFESTLPILEIVIAEESLPKPEDEPIPALMRVFDREGVNRPGDMPSALLPFARVRHRGASSMHSHYRQHSIRLEILDEKQKPSRFDLCGLAPDDDFALIASGMDRSLIRDWMAYALAAPLIPFTPRGRFVEVFVRNARARLDEQTYQGVYLAMEQIEAGPHRVDIGPLEVASTREGLEGGGWLLQSDRMSTNRACFQVGDESFTIVGPGRRELTAEGFEYIREDFGRFHAAMRGGEGGERLMELLDMDSFVNMLLLQEFTKNVDAFRFSTYFHRAAGGRLVAGPPWDFNLSMGNARSFASPEGFLLPGFPYAQELLRDERVFGLCRERWKELRREGGAFSDERILELIDEAVGEVGPAAARHFGRYSEMLRPQRTMMFTSTYPVDSFEAHARIVRDFLLRRGRWLDEAWAGMEGPEDLFSEEVAREEQEADAVGTGWWSESGSPPLRRRSGP